MDEDNSRQVKLGQLDVCTAHSASWPAACGVPAGTQGPGARET